MKLVMCAVLDTAAGAFMPPFCSRTRGEAMRGFKDACKSGGFRDHPRDYCLFLIAEFDDSNGYLAAPTQPEPLLTASDAIAMEAMQ